MNRFYDKNIYINNSIYMLLSNIFQENFPVQYFDEGFFNDFLPVILNEMKKTKNDKISKEKDEKKYYHNIVKAIAQGEQVFFDEINIYENDIDTLKKGIRDEIKKYLPVDLQEVNLDISIENFIDGNVTILTIHEAPGLYLKKSVLPLIYTQIPFLPFDEFKIIQNDFIKYCFDSGVFKEESVIEEIETRFTNISKGDIDEDGFDMFLYCAELLLNINIIVISNKFIGCDNCKKYFFTSRIPERQILESRPCYFIYRYIDDTDATVYYKIDFLDINTKTILDDYSDFSIKRLIRKYNENYELNQIPQVFIEPTDIDRELPMIEIEIEQKTIKLLIGSTYNLYTLDHKLVGKMDIIDIKSENGICNIHWIDKYPQKLL
jgi:hypothetical protein